MSWLEKSLMHTRGISSGKVGKTHELTEKLQGKFQYTMGPYSDPVLNIDPGDRVVVETVDAFEGVIKTEKDLPSQKLIIPFLNPQCGPIMVEGAEKGDVVAVHIESILPRGKNPRARAAPMGRNPGQPRHFADSARCARKRQRPARSGCRRLS